MGRATGRLLLIGNRALMPVAATAAASGDGVGWAACPTIAGRGWNDVAVTLSFDRSVLDAADNNYILERQLQILKYNITKCSLLKILLKKVNIK